MPIWFKSTEEKLAIADATAAYRGLIASLRADPARLRTLAVELAALRESGQRQHLPKRESEEVRQGLIAAAADTALADDTLTADEEESLLAALTQLGVRDDNAEQIAPGLMNRLVVARSNDGRLPELAEHRLLTPHGEVVHAEVEAALMKWSPLEEYRGASQGVSIRIAKGVRYRVGAQRGHLVTVGTQLDVADSGTLTVTDRRIVFGGRAKTLTFPYRNLATFEVYADGIQLGVTNRQATSLFRVASVDPLAALISAAAHRALDA
jgi:hypothetical protein